MHFTACGVGYGCGFVLCTCHGLSCRKSAGRHPRHTQINNLIHRALGLAQYPSVLEPVGLSATDAKRPDGKTVFNFKNGKPLAWDFTCPDTFALSHLSGTAREASHAATKAEKSKNDKYAHIVSTNFFIPIAIETMGSWGPEGIKFVRDLGKKISIITHDQQSTSHLMQRISIAIQQGNALSVMGTPSSQAKLEEIYYL